MKRPSNITWHSTITIVLMACTIPTYYFPVLAIGSGGLALRSFDLVTLGLPFLFLLAPPGWWSPRDFQVFLFWVGAFAISVAISSGVLFLVHRPDREELARIFRAVLRLYEVFVLASVGINALRHVGAKQSFNIVLLVCAVLPAYSLYLSLTSGGSFTRIGSYASRGSAAFGIEGSDQSNFNELGSLCATLAAGSAGLFLLAKTQRLRLIYIASFLIYTAGVFLTSSRSGLVAEMAGLVLLVLVLRASLRRKALILAAPVLLVLMNPRMYEIIYNRFSETMVVGSHDYVSAYTRFEGMQSAWNIFAEHPFIGVGYAAFRLFSAEGFITPECYYLEILADLGMLGAIAFCGLVFHSVWRGWRLVGEAHDIYIATGLAPVATLLVSNISGNNFFDPSLLMVFLIVLGSGVIHPPTRPFRRHSKRRHGVLHGQSAQRPQSPTVRRS